MIKPKNNYTAPFDIEYDILSMLDSLVNGISSLTIGIGANSTCGCDNTEIVLKLNEIKDSIDNKECGVVEVIKEVEVEKPVYIDVEKPVEVIKEVIVEKPVEVIKEVVKIVYRDCNCNCHCNHENQETEIINQPSNNNYTINNNSGINNNIGIDYSCKTLDPNNTTNEYVYSAVCSKIRIKNPYFNFQKAQRENIIKKIPTMTTNEIINLTKRHPEYSSIVNKIRCTKTIKKSIAH